MEKPHTFAGRVMQKFGKKITNDYAQPDKFFADMEDFHQLLDGVPFSAIEDLKKYELNRDIVIKSLQRLFTICSAANINIMTEVKRMSETPFDGLEEDLAKKKSIIRISGELADK